MCYVATFLWLSRIWRHSLLMSELGILRFVFNNNSRLIVRCVFAMSHIILQMAVSSREVASKIYLKTFSRCRTAGSLYLCSLILLITFSSLEVLQQHLVSLIGTAALQNNEWFTCSDNFTDWGRCGWDFISLYISHNISSRLCARPQLNELFSPLPIKTLRGLNDVTETGTSFAPCEKKRFIGNSLNSVLPRGIWSSPVLRKICIYSLITKISNFCLDL